MDSQWWRICLFLAVSRAAACPTSDTIQPCVCTNRNDDLQIWCTHSDLPQVLNGIQKIGNSVRKPIDELIIENNYLPSLPGKLFQNVKILRLMLRHNGVERLALAWLETQENSLMELYIVEDDLRSLPSESLEHLRNIQAITIQSQSLKRMPTFSGHPFLRYISIQTSFINTISSRTFENLPSLEKLIIQGSPNLKSIKEDAFYNLPKLYKLDLSNSGIYDVHMRSLALLPNLREVVLENNEISDASMIGQAIRDLPSLSRLNLNHNHINILNEAAFVDLPMLETLHLSNNKISMIHHGAFYRVPKLRIVELNYNKISRIHPESFLQQSGSGVEELSLIGNNIIHVSEFRALLDALPRLKFLDFSGNLLEEIPRGALRGHPNLERLHLNENNIRFIDIEAFAAMPALRELRLSNNTLDDTIDGPYWDLPALKGLDLSYNYFQRIQPKLLYNLPSLRRLDLSGNRIAMIDPITLLECPLLEHVNISGNTLVSIHPATFRNLANLYELDASNNRLVEFVPGLPRGIEYLYLQKNQITSLPLPPSPDLELPSLRSLDISSNGIQKIPNMKTLPNLRKFYLRRNGLRQIDLSTFSDLEALEILDLRDNQIIAIHPKSFVRLRNLQAVNLHGNIMENFDLGAIEDNSVLSKLDFSKNKLKSIGHNLIKRAIDMEVLNISSNNLNALPPTLNMLPKLKTLDASYNHIKTFDGNIINQIQTLVELRMPYNKLIEVRTATFDGLRELQIINLENNQIERLYPRAITNLPNLMTVLLAKNHIVEIPDNAFTNLPQLRAIELQGNRLKHIAPMAFNQVPLVQYLNLSNNQIEGLDHSGLRQLMSLEVLDISLNRMKKMTASSFQYMEWLVELNLDNNKICYISGQPFNYMPRLKVLSMRHNRLSSITEAVFAKLRNNIAILDLDGNPLICNCHIVWLKSWLQESTSIGPRCADGTLIKQMPITRTECKSYIPNHDDLKYCDIKDDDLPLPTLATSQVFSSFGNRVKEQSITKNRINGIPSPEESEYFYDEYVDYPYNDTLTELNLTHIQINQNQQNGGDRNISKNTIVNGQPNSGFTFFGMPLPTLGKFFNTGRKIDWPDGKSQNSYKHRPNHPYDEPKFETGGFTPILPITSGGFKPIVDPNLGQKFNKGNTNTSSSTLSKVTIDKVLETRTTNNGANTSTAVYNTTKLVDGNIANDEKLTEFKIIHHNITVEDSNDDDLINVLITTDTTNDMTLQNWLETTTASYTKNIQNETDSTKFTSQVLAPSGSTPITQKKTIIKRPATVTKVEIPHVEHYELGDKYLPVNNRAGKTGFSNLDHTDKTRSIKNKNIDWYYNNYNKSNLDPYVAPEVIKSNGFEFNSDRLILLTSTFFILTVA